MRHGSRAFAALILAATGIGLLAGAAPAHPAGVTVTVSVTELRNAKGVVRACLTAAVKDFPDCHDDATSNRIVVPATGPVVLHFAGVAPGRYAIALLHDENDNGRMDRALLMMPKEGYGFSRDAKVVMGPPKFDAAAFDVGAEPASLTIRMRYMF